MWKKKKYVVAISPKYTAPNAFKIWGTSVGKDSMKKPVGLFKVKSDCTAIIAIMTEEQAKAQTAPHPKPIPPKYPAPVDPTRAMPGASPCSGPLMPGLAALNAEFSLGGGWTKFSAILCKNTQVWVDKPYTHTDVGQLKGAYYTKQKFLEPAGKDIKVKCALACRVYVVTEVGVLCLYAIFYRNSFSAPASRPAISHAPSIPLSRMTCSRRR